MKQICYCYPHGKKKALTMIYNPSAVSIWVIVDDKVIECKSGKCTKLF